MAKFGVNVVDLVDNMPLVFLIFLQNLSKKNSWTSYTMKKKFGRSFQLKTKILAGDIFLPPSQDI